MVRAVILEVFFVCDLFALSVQQVTDVTIAFPGPKTSSSIGKTCTTRDEQAGECLPKPLCRTPTGITRPIICSWNGTTPLICCRRPSVDSVGESTNLTLSSGEPILKPIKNASTDMAKPVPMLHSDAVESKNSKHPDQRTALGNLALNSSECHHLGFTVKKKLHQALPEHFISASVPGDCIKFRLKWQELRNNSPPFMYEAVKVICAHTDEERESGCISVPLPDGAPPVHLCSNCSQVVCGLELTKELDGTISTRQTVVSPVGSDDAQEHFYPFMCVLGQKRISSFLPAGAKEYSWFCGGTLISDTFVLTAAHCLKSGKRLDVVRLGEHDLRSNPDTDKTSIDFKVAKWIIHPSYQSPSLEHDIALVQLANKVVFSETIRPACIHSHTFDIPDGANVTVVGWGAIGFGQRSSDALQQVGVPVWNIERCREAYGSRESFRRIYPNGIGSAHICAGSEGKDACQGDSGGPLLYQPSKKPGKNESDEPFYLVGVVSAGIGCGNIKYPGVYVRIDDYINWIEDHVAQEKFEADFLAELLRPASPVLPADQEQENVKRCVGGPNLSMVREEIQHISDRTVIPGPCIEIGIQYGNRAAQVEVYCAKTEEDLEHGCVLVPLPIPFSPIHVCLHTHGQCFGVSRCTILLPANDTKSDSAVLHSSGPTTFTRKSKSKFYPFLAALGERADVASSFLPCGISHFRNEFDWFCTGVLISDQFVLTSATCLDGEHRIDVIRLGENDLFSESDENSLDVKAAEFIKHPMYRHFTKNYINNGATPTDDIGLVKLSRRVLAGNIRPACLPSFELNLKESEMVAVVGWNRLRKNTEEFNTATEVNVPIWSHTSCNKSYSQISERFDWAHTERGITNESLCVGDQNWNACLGGIGSPILYRSFTIKPNGKYEESFLLLGVMSGVSTCGFGEFPGLYTRVDKYLPWIQEQLEFADQVEGTE